MIWKIVKKLKELFLLNNTLIRINIDLIFTK